MEEIVKKSVITEVKETCAMLTKEEHMLLKLLEKKQRITSYRGEKNVTRYASNSSPKGNTVIYADSTKDTHDTHALVFIPTIRSGTWIVDSGASQHVTGVVGEFSSYTRLVVSKNIQMADGTTRPVVGKDIVKCSMTLTKVLHAPSFFVNLLSISVIIHEQKYIVAFDIPKMVFQEKGTGRILGTRTWSDGLWYLDREEMDTTLATMVDRV
jgi:hypothetical protein